MAYPYKCQKLEKKCLRTGKLDHRSHYCNQKKFIRRIIPFTDVLIKSVALNKLIKEATFLSEIRSFFILNITSNNNCYEMSITGIKIKISKGFDL